MSSREQLELLQNSTHEKNLEEPGLLSGFELHFDSWGPETAVERSCRAALARALGGCSKKHLAMTSRGAAFPHTKQQFLPGCLGGVLISYGAQPPNPEPPSYSSPEYCVREEKAER